MDILLEPELQSLSRRGFLKLAGSALFSLLWLPRLGGQPISLLPQSAAAEEVSSLGRVLNNRATLRKRPNLNAEIIKRYRMDLILPITGATLGEDPSDYNRIWYEVNQGEGFTYSGGIQPVEVRDNPVQTSILESGELAEVTVPFTNAVWSIRQASSAAYRMYYSTTHWVMAVEQDKQGKSWYRIHDDKKGYNYYVDATHLRILPRAEITPLSPDVPMQDKRIEVHLKEQVVIAYEGSRPVFMTRTATGARFSDGDFRTKPGEYMTNRKRPSRHMAAGEPGVGTGFDLPGVPWVSYLTESGVSLHGTYWHNDFGSPRSHGCINLSSTAARWIYRWTSPVVPWGEQVAEEDQGTKVIIL